MIYVPGLSVLAASLRHTFVSIDFFESMMGHDHEVIMNGQRVGARFAVSDWEIRDCRNRIEIFMMLRKKFARRIKMSRSLRRFDHAR